MDLQNLDLNEIYQGLKSKKAVYENNEEYFRGMNVHILNRAPERKPDNRIPTPFVNSLSNNLSGYAATPGTTTYTYDKANTDEESLTDDSFDKAMKFINEKNSEPLYSSEQYQENMNQGKSYEIFYTLPAGENDPVSVIPYFHAVPYHEFFPFKNPTVAGGIDGGIWFRMVGEDVMATIYSKDLTADYIKRKKEPKFKLVQYEDGRQNPLPNIYGVSLVNYYTANKGKEPFWRPIRSLVDAHDEASNRALNELEKFSNAILLLAQEADQDFVENLDKLGVMDNLGDAEGGSSLPRFLERNINENFFKFLVEHYRDMIYQMSGIVNMSDPQLGNSPSGISILYKLQATEFQAARLDSYFDQGIKRRFEIIKAILKQDNKVPDAGSYSINIKHTRNIPQDLLNMANIARQLTGILSDETIIGIFPSNIVPDKKKELERLGQTSQPFPEVDDGESE